MINIAAPESPTIMTVSIPIRFREPSEETREASPVKQQSRQGERIIAADPPINSSAAGRLATLKRIREREKNWKSVGERTLEAAEKKKEKSSNIFATHIGKRRSGEEELAPAPVAIHYIDVVFNGMSKDDYRDRYGSIDTYYFEAQNPVTPDGPGQQTEEIADVLGRIVDSTIANDQVRRISMNDAKLRNQHVPLFSQLYKQDPVVDVDPVDVPNMRFVDEVEGALYDIVDKIIVEAAHGKFDLTKEILHVRGIKPID